MIRACCIKRNNNKASNINQLSRTKNKSYLSILGFLTSETQNFASFCRSSTKKMQVQESVVLTNIY